MADNLVKKKERHKEHREKMQQIRNDLAEGKITLEEAALAEVEELNRFTKALRNAV